MKSINVERTPVERPSSESDLDNSQDPKYRKIIEVHNRAEEFIVNKEARVVKKLNSKKKLEHQENIKVIYVKQK